jgi:hypothetical protein
MIILMILMPVSFDLVISGDGEEREYSLDYREFLEFIEEVDPNLKSYLVNRDQIR